MLDKVTVSRHEKLLACVKLEASLGLPLFKGENIKEPKFIQGVAERMPRLRKALEALIEDLVNSKNGRSLAFLDGFLWCLFQLKAIIPFERVDATLVNDPEDEALFKCACARGKLWENVPYRDTFPDYEVGVAINHRGL